MEKEIKAFVPAHLFEFLQVGKTGDVLLVTSSGIYLRIDGRIILLCDGDWGVQPIGIGIPDFKRAVSRLDPKQGQPVTVSAKRLIFPSGAICLTVQELPEETVDKPLPKLRCIRLAAENLSAQHKTRGISMLVDPLVLGTEPDTMPEQDPYCARARVYFSKLVAAFRTADTIEIAGCVEKLLGLGLGLTPSADDVLLGMLWIFRTLPSQCPESAAEFRERIARQCEQRTNQISAAYLKAIIAGAPFERMESVFRGLCGAEPLDIQQVTQIGSSSGSEMLLGMLIALRICGYDVSQEELQ